MGVFTALNSFCLPSVWYRNSFGISSGWYLDFFGMKFSTKSTYRSDFEHPTHFVSVSIPYHFRIISVSFSYHSPIVLLSGSGNNTETIRERTNDKRMSIGGTRVVNLTIISKFLLQWQDSNKLLGCQHAVYRRKNPIKLY